MPAPVTLIAQPRAAFVQTANIATSPLEPHKEHVKKGVRAMPTVEPELNVIKIANVWMMAVVAEQASVRTVNHAAISSALLIVQLG